MTFIARPSTRPPRPLAGRGFHRCYPPCPESLGGAAAPAPRCPTARPPSPGPSSLPLPADRLVVSGPRALAEACGRLVDRFALASWISRNLKAEPSVSLPGPRASDPGARAASWVYLPEGGAWEFSLRATPPGPAQSGTQSGHSESLFSSSVGGCRSPWGTPAGLGCPPSAQGSARAQRPTSIKRASFWLCVTFLTACGWGAAAPTLAYFMFAMAFDSHGATGRDHHPPPPNPSQCSCLAHPALLRTPSRRS